MTGQRYAQNISRTVSLLGILLLGTSCHSTAVVQEPHMLQLSGDLRVHDPAMIRAGDTFYVFSTGGSPRRGGIVPIRCSQDLYNWKRCGAVFRQLPAWAPQEIPGTRGAWAPDVSYFNGRYHVYYSISTFGKNNSAIGLVTNTTLDPNRPGYQWQDRGLVIRSTAGQTDWNAIDANLILEAEDKAWLCWGSFWSGIKMRRIDRSTGKLSAEDTTLYSLAARPRGERAQTPPVAGAVEAPYIIKHGDYLVFHAYDSQSERSRSELKISTMVWEDGWLRVAAQP